MTHFEVAERFPPLSEHAPPPHTTLKPFQTAWPCFTPLGRSDLMNVEFLTQMGPNREFPQELVRQASLFPYGWTSNSRTIRGICFLLEAQEAEEGGWASWDNQEKILNWQQHPSDLRPRYILALGFYKTFV